MRRQEVEINGRYVAKVSGRYVIVSIREEHISGGWIGVNETTGREVRIKSARRLDHMDGGPLDSSQVRTMTDSRVNS